MATPSLLRLILLIWLTEALVEAEFLANPGCKDSCGDVLIPFPFGIGPNCYMNEGFAVDCNTTSGRPKPFLTSIRMELLNVSPMGWVQVNNPLFHPNCSNDDYENFSGEVNMSGSPFIYSNVYNRFTATGCANYALLFGEDDNPTAGCLSFCHATGKIDHCYGINCCQATVPPNIKSFTIEMQSFSNHSCHHKKTAFIVDKDWLDFVQSLDKLPNRKYVPAVLEWGAFQGYCRPAKTSATFCSNNGYCWTELSQRHLCVCTDRSVDYLNYVPYILGGCPAGRSSGLGLLLLVIGARGLYKKIKRRNAVKLREKYFKRNCGLLLQKQLSSRDNNVEQTKLFSSKELEKATDHYNVSRILGQGGQGTVYKGMLTDGKIVAIKKSKIVDEDEGKLQQFINEVVILLQINHRNVVRLLGCCLETPLLVYEFIPNRTLFEHIHDQTDGEFPITWEMRLQIAAEVAGAVSYLHSAASIPIYHRDIKSTNILLDDKYRAKVSDFGTSRSIAVDQTHVTTTRVHGTMGYLDPEYWQTSQFTEKSDVYSFGVVLTELLTGQKPISSMRSVEQRSLATYFLQSMQENRLFEILDSRVLREGRKEEITAVAKLAKRCLHLNGKKRPTMKAVAMELEAIRASWVAAPSAIQQDFGPDEVDYAEGNTTGPWDAASSSSGSHLNRIAMHIEIDM